MIITDTDAQSIARLKRDIVFDVELRGLAMKFHSTWRLFSRRRIDNGTCSARAAATERSHLPIKQ